MKKTLLLCLLAVVLVFSAAPALAGPAVYDGLHSSDVFLSTSSGPVASYGNSNVLSSYTSIWLKNTLVEMNSLGIVVNSWSTSPATYMCSGTGITYCASPVIYSSAWNSQNKYESRTEHELYRNGFIWGGYSDDDVF